MVQNQFRVVWNRVSRNRYLIIAACFIFIFLFQQYYSCIIQFYNRITRSRKTIGLYMPDNHIIMSDKYGYFLCTMISTFQFKKYQNVLFLDFWDTCHTKSCITDRCNYLGVTDIDWLKVKISLKFTSTLYTSYHLDVFIASGIDKQPQMQGIGEKLNIYHSQSPFNSTYVLSMSDMSRLASYDIIFVESEYAHSWYAQYADFYTPILSDKKFLPPSIKILHPPARKYPELERNILHHRDERFINIIVVDKLCTVPKNTGYLLAIEAFKRMVEVHKFNKILQLHLIGEFPASEQLDKLKSASKSLPLYFHSSDSNIESDHLLDKYLGNSSILWHLSGFHTLSSTLSYPPHCLDHSNDIILKSIMLNITPIVTQYGTAQEMIQHGTNGYIVNTVDELVTYTNTIISQLSSQNRLKLEILPKYNLDSFQKKLLVLADRGAKASVFRNFIREALFRSHQYSIPKIPIKSNLTAVIIEGVIESSFEFCVRNVIHFLGDGWALQVHHTKQNANHVRNSLKNIENVQFFERNARLDSISDYNKLLKSPEFWASIDSDKILLFQSDSIIIQKGIQKFKDFDYIGAPWDFVQNEVAISMRDSGDIPNGVGNGGFSFRNGRLMESLCRQFGPISSVNENEDVFFAKLVQKYGTKIPTREEAKEFCLEFPIQLKSAITLSKSDESQQSYKQHYSLHAAWYYHSDEDLAKHFSMSLDK